MHARTNGNLPHGTPPNVIDRPNLCRTGTLPIGCRDLTPDQFIQLNPIPMPLLPLKMLAASPLLLVLASGTCAAESFPLKPIRMIVPFPAGGPTDIATRILAQRITEAWGQQVVVDNRGGGNGIIGQEAAAKATPDGYTVLMQSVAFVINPSLYRLPYDTLKDFVPVTQVAGTALELVVNPSLPVHSVSELIASAKMKPGDLNFASFGQGSIAHLAGELLAVSAGVNMTHVPYKGVQQALSEVIAGQVQAMFPGIPSALPFTRAGKLRGLAVTSRQRSSLAPELPTMIEAGIRDYEAVSWFGLFLPALTPPTIVTKLHDEVVRVAQIPEVKAQLEAQGFVPITNRPDEFAAVIRREIGKYARLVKAAHITVQ